MKEHSFQIYRVPGVVLALLILAGLMTRASGQYLSTYPATIRSSRGVTLYGGVNPMD